MPLRLLLELGSGGLVELCEHATSSRSSAAS
jgi:hypothetical protein